MSLSLSLSATRFLFYPGFTPVFFLNCIAIFVPNERTYILDKNESPNLIELMCLADLEFDHINPYDSATRINQVVIPEYVVQAALCTVFFLTGHWTLSLLCVPYLYYNITSYMNNRHYVDVTEIFNSVSREKKKRLLKLGYIFCVFFLSIFWLIWSTLDEEDY